jgi:hypothetical protein
MTGMCKPSSARLARCNMGGDSLSSKPFVPGLWQANGSHADRARLFGLQRIAHVRLQRMRGMGDGREYTKRPAPGHMRGAQMSLRTIGFIASFRHPILYSC